MFRCCWLLCLCLICLFVWCAWWGSLDCGFAVYFLFVLISFDWCFAVVWVLLGSFAVLIGYCYLFIFGFEVSLDLFFSGLLGWVFDFVVDDYIGLFFWFAALLVLQLFGLICCGFVVVCLFVVGICLFVLFSGWFNCLLSFLIVRCFELRAGLLISAIVIACCCLRCRGYLFGLVCCLIWFELLLCFWICWLVLLLGFSAWFEFTSCFWVTCWWCLVCSIIDGLIWLFVGFDGFS